VLRDQEEDNLKEKLELITEAEKLKDSEEWEETHKALQNLMNRWKNIGPVPKRKSGKIWKKFKGAMDAFYEKRRDHFKDVKEERKDNLKEKKQVIEELKALQSHENPMEAVELAKPLQEKFKEAGYVPLKYKNKLWKDYREACDIIYERFRAVKSAADVVGKENVSDFSADDIADIRKKQKEADNLRKQIKKMSDEVLQMKESLSYFKASKGSTVLEDAHARIANMEKEIDKNEDALAVLEKAIDLMMKDS
jgi:conjugal transfer/entry exclusion protein